jgi:hypothetical protein
MDITQFRAKEKAAGGLFSILQQREKEKDNR